MKKVRVATIGYGFLGKWHAQKAAVLNELCDLIAIVEKFPEAQSLAKTAHPATKVVDDWQMIADSIDAAVIVTPTSLHFSVAKELLEAGKHVFCEKPLCSTSTEARLLEKMAHDKNLILQVGHSERCHAAWNELKLNELKGPVHLRIDRYAPFKGRATDVDVVQDLMIHDIDLMLWLFGRQVESVSTTGFKIRTKHWDHVSAHFKLSDGMQATITSGRNHVHEIRALEVFHHSGVTRVDLFTNKIQTAPASEVSPGVFTAESSYEKRDHLLIEQAAFYRSILKGEKVFVTATEGRVAIECVEAVLKSLATNSSVSLHA